MLMPHRLVVAETEVDAMAAGPPGPADTGPGNLPSGNDRGQRKLARARARHRGPAPRRIAGRAAGHAVPGRPPAVPFEPAVTGPSRQATPWDEPLDLPRRLRQASLAPQLRDAPPAGRPGAGGSHDGRSAEEVRAMISSIQRGWRSGRTEAGHGDGNWALQAPAGRRRLGGAGRWRGDRPGCDWLLENLIATVDRIRQAVDLVPGRPHHEQTRPG